MESNKPIYEYDNKGYGKKFSEKVEYKLLFVSDKLVNDIEKHGIVERKTFKLKFPFESMTKDLYSHYIRGYFDGDGSVFYTKSRDKENEVLCVSLCGTYEFLNEILSLFTFIKADEKCLYKDTRVLTNC